MKVGVGGMEKGGVSEKLTWRVFGSDVWEQQR